MIVALNRRAEIIDDVKDLCYCIGLCTSQNNAKELENSIEVLLDAEMNKQRKEVQNGLRNGY